MKWTKVVVVSLAFFLHLALKASAAGVLNTCEKFLELVPFSQKMGLSTTEEYLEWVQGRKSLASGLRAQAFYSVSDYLGAFSNFARYPVVINGRVYMTSEHYFQSQKFVGSKDEEEIRLGGAPKEMARMARDRSRPLRADWEEVKDNVMRRAVEAKIFQHPPLAELLLSTGDLILVEHTENDRQWGDAKDGTGYNKLGQILMETREKLKLWRAQMILLPEAASFLDYLPRQIAQVLRAQISSKEETSGDLESAEALISPMILQAAQAELRRGRSLEELTSFLGAAEARVLRQKLGAEAQGALSDDSPFLSRLTVAETLQSFDPTLALRLPLFLPGQKLAYENEPERFVAWAKNYAQNLKRPILNGSFTRRILYDMLLLSTFHDISEEQFKEIESAILRAAQEAPGYQGIGEAVVEEAIAVLSSELWGQKGFKSKL